jgi:hypothetical protein
MAARNVVGGSSAASAKSARSEKSLTGLFAGTGNTRPLCPGGDRRRPSRALEGPAGEPAKFPSGKKRCGGRFKAPYTDDFAVAPRRKARPQTLQAS